MRTIAKFKGLAVGYERGVVYTLYFETSGGKIKMYREYKGQLVTPIVYDTTRAFLNDWQIIT